ncbi:MAG: hypothetical protein M3245_04040 [Actinomycetota bacterium]|nr:hypothetical protein [Actinomycetota bacterium]
MARFERGMEVLANTNGTPGRWVLAPRKDDRFVGSRSRVRQRVRERRRQVFTVLLEAIGLTALIGAVPPLRAMWYVTGVLLALLGAYVFMLLRIKAGRSFAPPLPATPEEAFRPPAGLPVHDVVRDSGVVIVMPDVEERRAALAGRS